MPKRACPARFSSEPSDAKLGEDRLDVRALAASGYFRSSSAIRLDVSQRSPPIAWTSE